MKNTEYLSFTHGTTLQCFCKSILDNANVDLKSCWKWLENERGRLLKTQPQLWQIPVSTCCYFNLLDQIEQILVEGSAPDKLPGLLQHICEITRTKIHALFMTQEMACWPSLESVFAAAQQSEDFEASLVYTPFYHENFSEQVDYYDAYRELGLPVLRHNEYDLPADSPDVAFMIKPYGNVPEPYICRNIGCVVPRIVYIPYGMEITTDLIKFGFQFYGHYITWRHCAYGQVVKDYGTKYGYRNGENIAVWGHPKADYYLTAGNRESRVPEEWKHRIGSRKTILWTPHHLIDLNENGTGTWLIWGERILKAAQENPELFFIIRPHPLMMGALVNTGAMTQEEADRLRQTIDASENILWDTNDDYRIAFEAADAIITDGTTFSVEFLYTKKPILLTPRNMEGFYIYEEMLECYYIVNSIQDIYNFMEMVRTGNDPLREKRLALYEKTFFVPEHGTVGENIMRQVKNDLEKECVQMNIKTVTPQPEVVSQTDGNSVDVAQFPLFSILVLCYKNQELLFGMLDSIFRQDYPRIQLVVSDDGSEDFDVEQVQKYIEMHKRSNIVDVIVRKNPQNMRTVRHIDLAWSFVTGDYAVFTAADDRFCGTDTVSAYVEQFLSNPEKVWLVAKCSVTSADYKKHLHYLPTEADEPFFRMNDAQRLFSRWSRRGMAIPCCMAFRKDAVDMICGFDRDYQFLEDWPVVLKLLRSGHAPIFFEQVTALHSAGGVTNSNQRYGKEIRRLFYEDKYTIFRKEVKPYFHLLTPEDKKAFHQYQREIMARHYFFYIDWPDTSVGQKIRLLLAKPIRAWWLFENLFTKMQDRIPKKKILLASQAVLLLSMLFLNNEGSTFTDQLFRVMGWIDLVAGLGMMLAALLAYPLKKYFEKKADLRHDLVN